jgi:hypothetical protein
VRTLPVFRPRCSSRQIGTGFLKPAPMRHFPPIRPPVCRYSQTLPVAIALMIERVRSESSPFGLVSMPAQKPRIHTLSSTIRRERQPSGVRTSSWW